MRFSTRSAAPALLALAACAPRAAQTPTPDPAAPPVAATVHRSDPDITAADLRRRLYAFADDSMLGREAGELGNVKATDYLAAELRRMGVEPAGENGTYFQTIPFSQRRIDTTAVLKVDGQPIALDDDYLPIPNYGSQFPFGMSATFTGTPVAFGGLLGADNLISPEAARGRFVIFGPPMSPVDIQSLMAEIPVTYSQAAGVAFAFLEFIPGPQRGFMTEPQTGLGDELPGGPVGLVITTQTAARMLGTPLGGATVGSGTGILDGEVRFAVSPIGHPARNVIGVVRGRDPGLRGQYVSLGAHTDHDGIASRTYDHDSLRIFNRIVRPGGAEDMAEQATASQLAQVRAALEEKRRSGFPRPDSIMNGADDDGSGSMVLLEIAEAFATAEPKPRRSILFVFHTAEEKGLLGAEYFTDNPTVPLDSIVSNVNMDMVGRGGADDIEGGGPGYVQMIGSRRLSTELGDLVEEVNVRGEHGLQIDYQFDVPGHPQQFYCRSDHYMYARYGIPVAFLSTGSHLDYHMVTDEPQYIDYDKMTKVARYLYDLSRTIADLDHRLVVDQPKPDPDAPCVQ